MKFLKLVLVITYTYLVLKFIRIFILNGPTDVLEIEYVFKRPKYLVRFDKKLKKLGNNLTKFNFTIPYEMPQRLSTDLKFILKWTVGFYHRDFAIFTHGQLPFIQRNCSFFNCYASSDKNLLKDYRNFDAILFDEDEIEEYPTLRAEHQKYVFVGSESADHYPICQSKLDNFFNITWTYRLDSDIVWPFFCVLNKTGHVVGPKMDVSWHVSKQSLPKEVQDRLRKKKLAVAWFVSNCKTKSRRETLALKLKIALGKHGLLLDIFGYCGTKKCSKSYSDECLKVIEENYYFYLSFENSMSEDYVTEHLLHALQHYTVPIVYGGANYSRFLPPDSYLNAKVDPSEVIAEKVKNAIQDNEVYENYFRWHNLYKYLRRPPVSDLCELCRILNQGINSSTVKNFRRWWSPNYAMQCAQYSTVKAEDLEKFPKIII